MLTRYLKKERITFVGIITYTILVVSCIMMVFAAIGISIIAESYFETVEQTLENKMLYYCIIFYNIIIVIYVVLKSIFLMFTHGFEFLDIDDKMFKSFYIDVENVKRHKPEFIIQSYIITTNLFDKVIKRQTDVHTLANSLMTFIKDNSGLRVDIIKDFDYEHNIGCELFYDNFSIRIYREKGKKSYDKNLYISINEVEYLYNLKEKSLLENIIHEFLSKRFDNITINDRFNVFKPDPLKMVSCVNYVFESK